LTPLSLRRRVDAAVFNKNAATGRSETKAVTSHRTPKSDARKHRFGVRRLDAPFSSRPLDDAVCNKNAATGRSETKAVTSHRTPKVRRTKASIWSAAA